MYQQLGMLGQKLPDVPHEGYRISKHQLVINPDSRLLSQMPGVNVDISVGMNRLVGWKTRKSVLPRLRWWWCVPCGPASMCPGNSLGS